MRDDETQEVPLPEGTMPDPESVITQEIPVRGAFPEIKLVSPVKVELPPLHLINEPIMTMDAPVPDDTALYDQLNPPAPKPLPKRTRRRMKTGDKFLAGLCVTTIGMGTVAYGMAVYGWGAGPMPQDEAAKPRQVVSVETEEPEVLPTTGPQPTYRPPTKAPVKIVSAPTSYSPEPERTITVVTPPPTPEETTSAPVAPVETSEAPEPSPTYSEPSTPPPSPTVTEESPSPTPEESESASLLPSLLPSASPSEESTDG